MNKMNYREEYHKLVEKMKGITLKYYGERLVSFIVFGSLAADTFRKDSDIDVLIVADRLPDREVK